MFLFRSKTPPNPFGLNTTPASKSPSLNSSSKPSSVPIVERNPFGTPEESPVNDSSNPFGDPGEDEYDEKMNPFAD